MQRSSNFPRLSAIVILQLCFAQGCQQPQPRPGGEPPELKPGAAGRENPRPLAEPSVPDIKPIDRESLNLVPDSPYWRLVKAGKLRIGIGRTAPFSAKTSAGHDGFDIALARKLAEVLGLEIELRELNSLKDGFAALNAKEAAIDLIIASCTRSAERAALCRFSRPYLTISQGALVEKRLVEGTRAGAEVERQRFDNYGDLARLPGLQIGVVAGTIPDYYARTSFPGAKIKAFPSLAEALTALSKGELGAVAHDAPALRLWLATESQLAYRFNGLFGESSRDSLCIGMRRGDPDFASWLDDFVAELEERGVIERWRRQYLLDFSWLKR